jgi:hypothetical protein
VAGTKKFMELEVPKERMAKMALMVRMGPMG